jgi:periplasmic protein TonB
MPRFAYKPCPQYPYVARRRSLEGTVLLRVQMLANGTVGTVEIAKSSGSSALDDAAQRAVQKWTHTPGNGNHAPHWVQVPVNFRLQRGNSPNGDGTAAASLHLNCDS